MEPTRVTVEQVKEWLDQGKTPVFVDARSEAAWEESAVELPNAIRIPADAVESRLNSNALPTGKPIVTYCT